MRCLFAYLHELVRSHICTKSLSSAFLMPLPIDWITLTKLLPGSISTRLKMRGILIPTLATPYVAIRTLLSASLISSYCYLRSFSLTSPLIKTESGIASRSCSPALILSTSIRVLPLSLMPLHILAKYLTLSLFVTRYLSSS